MEEVKIQPELTTAIIAFDIHGVLFKPSYKRIARLIQQNKWCLGILRFLFYPKIFYTLSRFFIKKATAQEYIDFARNHPKLNKYIPLAIQMANAHDPILRTVNIAKKLKARGHELHIFSNIGTTLLSDLVQKYPTIFALFDEVNVPLACENYLSKPRKAAFEQYVANYNQNNKQIIFIDDNRHNIRNAYATGILGIFYDKPAQLHEQLEKIGAL